MISKLQWTDELLKDPIAIDTETTDIQLGERPNLVLWTATDDGKTVYYGTDKNIDSFISKHLSHLKIFLNAPFDLGVINNLLLYDNPDKIHDIGIFWKLLWLAKDGFIPPKSSLAEITKYCLNYELKKDKELRMGWKVGMNFSEEKLNYAIEDAAATFNCWKRLYRSISKLQNMLSYGIQIRAALALDDIENQGIEFDLNKREEVLKDLQKKIDPYLKYLIENNYKPKEKGNSIVLYNYIENLIKEQKVDYWPRTIKTGKLMISESTLSPYKKDKFIFSLLEYRRLHKLKGFIENIKTNRIYPRYDLLKVSGRTSSKNPNLQQFPKEGNIRDCFIAAKNHKLIIADYATIELRTLAQICYTKYKFSKMRELLNKDIDLHIWLAKKLLRKNEITKEERQKAKAVNFGFPAGLGITRFIEIAKKDYGIEFTETEAWNAKRIWINAFPEMKKYLEFNVNGKVRIKTLTGRIRAGCKYTEAKNTPFQGLAADGAKLALWECFMAGLKIVGFIHDEIIIESLESKVPYNISLLKNCMIKGMQEVIPDVKIKVETKIFDRWIK